MSALINNLPNFGIKRYTRSVNEFLTPNFKVGDDRMNSLVVNELTIQTGATGTFRDLRIGNLNIHLGVNAGLTNQGRTSVEFISSGTAPQIVINLDTIATPYPKILNVDLSSYTYDQLDVVPTLYGFNHTYPEDVRVLLEAPNGNSVLLLSEAGGSRDAINVDISFSDYASSRVRNRVVNGIFLPSSNNDSEMTSPAPTGPYFNQLSYLTTGTVNGNWKLWVLDIVDEDDGTIDRFGLEFILYSTGAKNAIAIGHNSGMVNQAEYSIAIGSYAGQTNQHTKSIILNATGAPLNSITEGLFVAPIRASDNEDTLNTLVYNTTTKEIKYKPFSYIPPGVINAFAGDFAPNGYLICDGSEISRFEYADLFDAIGGIYGEGNGTGTFNIPDLRSRIPVGYDNSSTYFNSFSNTGGVTDVTLTVNQIPSHAHAGTTDINGAHTHTQTTINDDFNNTGGNYGGDYTRPSYPPSDSAGTITWTGTINSNGAHTHTFTSNNTGGGESHTNVQPYITMNYIIKY